MTFVHWSLLKLETYFCIVLFFLKYQSISAGDYLCGEYFGKDSHYYSMEGYYNSLLIGIQNFRYIVEYIVLLHEI